MDPEKYLEWVQSWPKECPECGGVKPPTRFRKDGLCWDCVLTRDVAAANMPACESSEACPTKTTTESESGSAPPP